MSTSIVKESSANGFGYNVETLTSIEPVLRFLYQHWWRVESKGFEKLPKHGPALIVGNTSGFIPWTALMLLYTLKPTRRVNIVCDLDWVKDPQLTNILQEIGFVPWSSANLKELFAQGELVAMFPEGTTAIRKTITMQNRVAEFDWTRFLPAIEEGIKIFHLATLGCDEASPVFFNLDSLAKALSLKAFPITPFFPWLPFPFNLGSLPIRWEMDLLPAPKYEVGKEREKIQECAKKQAFLAEGAIQAQLNMMLRLR